MGNEAVHSFIPRWKWVSPKSRVLTGSLALIGRDFGPFVPELWSLGCCCISRHPKALMKNRPAGFCYKSQTYVMKHRTDFYLLPIRLPTGLYPLIHLYPIIKDSFGEVSITKWGHLSIRFLCLTLRLPSPTPSAKWKALTGSIECQQKCKDQKNTTGKS